jgi:hypothetical protein
MSTKKKTALEKTLKDAVTPAPKKPVATAKPATKTPAKPAPKPPVKTPPKKPVATAKPTPQAPQKKPAPKKPVATAKPAPQKPAEKPAPDFIPSSRLEDTCKARIQCTKCDAVNPGVRLSCNVCGISLYDFNVRFANLNGRLKDAVALGDEAQIKTMRERIVAETGKTFGLFKVLPNGEAVRMKTTTQTVDGEVVAKKTAARKDAPLEYGVKVGTPVHQFALAVKAAGKKGITMSDIKKQLGTTFYTSASHEPLSNYIKRDGKNMVWVEK